MNAAASVVRHVLPGLGLLPRNLDTDSVSGLVGSALGFAQAAGGWAGCVDLWGLANPARSFDRYLLGGVQVRAVRPWRLGRIGRRDLRYQLAAALAAASSGPATILHVHASPTLLLLPKARRRLLHLHMALGAPTRLESLLLQRADAVVCASAYLAAGFRERHPQYRGLVRVVRNGADPDRYGDLAGGLAYRRALGLKPDDRLVVFAGQVAPEKGVDRLVTALEIFSPEERPHLLIAGSSTLWRSVATAGIETMTPFEQALRRRCARLPVHWLGKVAVNTMPNLLLAADIVCCPSVVAEGLATINLEAAAAGKPVIASRIGGIPEIVVDGVSGVLVPPGDSTALARALSGLLNDAARRRQLGAAARRKVHRWTAAGEEMLSVYDQLLAGAPQR